MYYLFLSDVVSKLENLFTAIENKKKLSCNCYACPDVLLIMNGEEINALYCHKSAFICSTASA